MSFQPRSSSPEPTWPKPCGRMAGRAAPLRASRPEDSEANALGSSHCGHSLLADHAAAEATDGTRAGDADAGACVRRGEDGAAEILLEPVGDIIPQLDHFARRAAVGIDFHHRAAVDHRGGEIGAVVERDRSDGAVLRQRDRGFVGDLGLGRRGVDDEQQAACRRGRTDRPWRRRRADRAGSGGSG